MGRAPEWTSPELEVLRTVYVDEGLVAAMKYLPRRNAGAIFQKAFKLGLKCEAQHFPTGRYQEISDEAWRLRHDEKLSYAAIGVVLGVCEAQATNAVLYAECIKAGHTPLQRHTGGKLHPDGRDRLRAMFRKGWTHRKIQEWTGCPAATLTRERKVYAAELKAKGLAPLPPIGGGERYSGAKIPKADSRKVEALYLEGFGTAKVSARTGVSKTHCLRMRTKLIKRLKRKGECLPGCDENGRRHVMKDHARRIPAMSIARFKKLIRKGETVARAARIAVIGRSSADKIVKAMVANGFALRTKPWRGRALQAKQRIGAQDLPGGRWGIDRYRAHVHAGMRHEKAAARAARDWQDKMAVERANRADRRLERKDEEARSRSFEEQLAAVAAGAKLGPTFRPTRRGPDFTLGGVATGAFG